MRRYAPATPPKAFRYSWQFDGGAWTPFTANPTPQLFVGGLPPGVHRLALRALDADGNVSPPSDPAVFRILPVALQNRPWFAAAVASLAVLIFALVWLGVTRTREIARRNAALQVEIAERRRAEHALEQTRAGLEARVIERTAELSRANDSLRSEIGERQAADEHGRQLEEQLRQAQKMQAIGTLAGGIAHDFNNILTVIIPSSNLAMLDERISPEVRMHLDQILAAAERARDLVQQILAFSRRHQPARRVVNLGPIVQETIKLARAALPTSIEVVSEISPDAPAVLADPSQVHQVLMNLCTNAGHAMRDRAGRLVISAGAIVLKTADAEKFPGLLPGRYAASRCGTTAAA